MTFAMGIGAWNGGIIMLCDGWVGGGCWGVMFGVDVMWPLLPWPESIAPEEQQLLGLFSELSSASDVGTDAAISAGGALSLLPLVTFPQQPSEDDTAVLEPFGAGYERPLVLPPQHPPCEDATHDRLAEVFGPVEYAWPLVFPPQHPPFVEVTFVGVAEASGVVQYAWPLVVGFDEPGCIMGGGTC